MNLPATISRAARVGIALALAVLAAGWAGARPVLAAPTVILVSMDGMHPRDLDAALLPALARMAREGVRADRLAPVFPTNTFPNHVSLVTGVVPARHGIVSNVFRDPERGVHRYASDPTWLETEPLWSILGAHGLPSASFHWVGSEGKWRSGRGPTWWKPFSSRTPESEKVDQVLAWLDLPEAERPRLVTCWFHGADHAGHRHGPGAPEVAEALREQDAALARLQDGIGARGLWPETTLVVVSDHGMAAIEREVDLEGALEDAGVAAEVLGAGGFATVVLERPVDDLVAARAAARALGLEAWAPADAPPGLASDHPRFGDLVVLAPPGTAIRRGGLLGRLRAVFTGGVHGHRPDHPDMSGIFLALGRGVEPGRRLESVRALDVAPTVLALLDLPVPSTMQGQPVELSAAGGPSRGSGG